MRRYTLRHAAEARSLIGDNNGVERSLDQLADRLDIGEDQRYPWPEQDRQMPSYVTTRQATCCGRLGRADQAARLWQGILAEFPADARRTRGVYLARYAQALHDAEGPRAAIDTAAKSVQCLKGADSTRLRRELARLSNKVQPSVHTSAGRELHDLLATVA